MFYKRLDYICKKKGTTVTGVAKKLKISTSNVTNWKSGVIPKGEIIIRLAELLNVSCDYLLLGKEPTTKATMMEIPKPQLTENEEDMLNTYRNLNELGQRYIKQQIDIAKNSNMIENQIEMFEVFSKFTEREQVKIICKIENWHEEKVRRSQVQQSSPSQQTAIMVAKTNDGSIKNQKSVTGDFSDIINAPPSTTKY